MVKLRWARCELWNPLSCCRSESLASINLNDISQLTQISLSLSFFLSSRLSGPWGTTRELEKGEELAIRQSLSAIVFSNRQGELGARRNSQQARALGCIGNPWAWTWNERERDWEIAGECLCEHWWRLRPKISGYILAQANPTQSNPTQFELRPSGSEVCRCAFEFQSELEVVLVDLWSQPSTLWASLYSLQTQTHKHKHNPNATYAHLCPHPSPHPEIQRTHTHRHSQFRHHHHHHHQHRFRSDREEGCSLAYRPKWTRRCRNKKTNLPLNGVGSFSCSLLVIVVYILV